MKFSNILIATISLGLAKADFFQGISRPKLFELTEFNMPTLKINFSDEAYNRFKLTYQCLYDTHPLVDIENEECYKASWNNYSEIINNLIQDNVIDSNLLSVDQQNLINTELSYDDFKNIINTASNLPMKDIFSPRNTYTYIPTFEEKKASFEFTINGETTFIDDVKISVGGKYTQNFEKPQFNLNIKDGDLYGIQHIRLRSEVIDPSLLRSKIGSDITTLLGFPSNQANFSKVMLNNDDMGLYLLRDAIKPKWVENNFGVANTTSLYTCGKEYGESMFFNCVNEDTEENDEDIMNFKNRIENVQSVQELSQFFDTDLYIKWQAYKYLVGSWDHVTNQHNQYLYKDGDKWLDILYDFDSDLGAYKVPKAAQTFTQESLENDFPLYKIIGLDDNHPQLVEHIKNMVMNGFNPVVLIPRIDELVTFLHPYVIEDRTPENDPTARPGHFIRADYKIENGFTADDFVKNSGFHNYHLKKYFTETNYDVDVIYGVKRWIIERFRFVCTQYNLDCSFASEYLEGGSYNVPSEESTDVVLEEHKEGCNKSGYPCCIKNDSEILHTDEAGDWRMEGSIWCLVTKDQSLAENGNNGPSINDQAQLFTNSDSDCWSLAKGYPCCQYSTEVHYVDDDGSKWSVENDDWCGIVETQSFDFGNGNGNEIPQSAAAAPSFDSNPFSHW